MLHLWLADGVGVHAPLQAGAVRSATPMVVRLAPRIELPQPTVAPEPGRTKAEAPARLLTGAKPVPPNVEAPAPTTTAQKRDPAHTLEPHRALPQARDPTYYTAREIDTYPRPVEPLGFTHPDTANGERASARLVVELLIDEFGVVQRASLVEGAPANRLAQTALAALGAARFHPASKDGRAVKSRILVAVSYDPAGTPSPGL